jgi:hypothetical protein
MFGKFVDSFERNWFTDWRISFDENFLPRNKKIKYSKTSLGWVVLLVYLSSLKKTSATENISKAWIAGHVHV